LNEDRLLILGGIDIPSEKGLMGHSDADVLIHAICDALLGAAGLGDIGMHFPDSDPAFKDISSIKILRKTLQMVRSKGFSVVNIDTVQTTLAAALELEPQHINIKATTTEGLGMIGRGEGIGAMAVALIE
jgi:2-C-methyl-D-erythritol 2,4-cyclodiphosphate synthase